MEDLILELTTLCYTYLESFILVLPKLLMAAIAFTILYLLANRTKRIVNSKLTQQMDDPLLARFLSRIVKIIIVLFALMVVMKILGLTDIAAGLLTGASVSAIVIGFAFKDIGENFLAGIILAFNRPFRVGDVVELNGDTGSVVALDMRTTQIKTFDGKDIYIPNADVMKNPVINFTIDGFIRHEFSIGLDYGTDVDQAIAIVKAAIHQTEGILLDKKQPNVFIGGMSPSTLDLSVQYWLDTFNPKISGSIIKTNAIKNCLTALTDAGIYLPGDILELKNYEQSVLSIKTNE